MAYTDIFNPPITEPGQVAVWDGSEYVIEPLADPSYIPAWPIVPDPYFINRFDVSLNKWEVEEDLPPPAPTPVEVSTATLEEANSQLSFWAAWTIPPMSTRIDANAQAIVTTYLGDMLDIISTAQDNINAGTAYEPTFPDQPNLTDGSIVVS